MFKKLITTFPEFVNIADIFGYIFVTLIVLACWIGYNNAHQKAAETKIKAEIKVEEIKNKVKEITQKSEISLETRKIESTLNTPKESLLSKYYNSFKNKLNFFSYDSAKNTLQGINEKVNETIKDASGIGLDPRTQNYEKGIPKKRSVEDGGRDTLSTL